MKENSNRRINHAEVIRMYEEGQTGVEIAKHYGCSHSYIYKLLSHYRNGRLSVITIKSNTGKLISCIELKNGYVNGSWVNDNYRLEVGTV